jgi:hypothetical protein
VRFASGCLQNLTGGLAKGNEAHSPRTVSRRIFGVGRLAIEWADAGRFRRPTNCATDKTSSFHQRKELCRHRVAPMPHVTIRPPLRGRA